MIVYVLIGSDAPLVTGRAAFVRIDRVRSMDDPTELIA